MKFERAQHELIEEDKTSKIIKDYKKERIRIVFEFFTGKSIIKKILYSPFYVIARLWSRLPLKKSKKKKKSILVSKLATNFIQQEQALHRENPAYCADRIRAGMPEVINQFDFAEVADMFENSEEDIKEISKAVMDVFFQSISKFINLTTILPVFGNIVIGSLNNILIILNSLSPDAKTQLFISLLDEIDGKSLGRFINEANELTRSIHAGSALLGEPGFPLFPVVLNNLLRDSAEIIDPELYWMGRFKRSEGRETIKNTITGLLGENPDFIYQMLKKYSDIHNSRLRSLKQRVEVIDELPEKELADSVEHAISGISSHDMAEIVNLVCGILNKIKNIHPDVAATTVTQFMDSVDIDEFREAAKWIMDSAAESLKPVSRAVIPELVKTLCVWFEPENDGTDDAMEEARKQLYNLLTKDILPK